MTTAQGKDVTTTNIQIAKDGYAAFQNGELDVLLGGLFAEDIELVTPTVPGAPFYGTKHGRQAVRAFLEALAENETFLHFQPEEFIAQDNRVVALGRSTSRVNATGREYETDWVHIFTMTEGKVSRLVEFFDNVKAERAYRNAK